MVNARFLGWTTEDNICIKIIKSAKYFVGLLIHDNHSGVILDFLGNRLSLRMSRSKRHSTLSTLISFGPFVSFRGNRPHK